MSYNPSSQPVNTIPFAFASYILPLGACMLITVSSDVGGRGELSSSCKCKSGFMYVRKKISPALKHHILLEWFESQSYCAIRFDWIKKLISERDCVEL